MKYELSMQELELQGTELLPTREALGSVNWADVYATNTAVAFNIASKHAEASAEANQAIFVHQD